MLFTDCVCAATSTVPTVPDLCLCCQCYTCSTVPALYHLSFGFWVHCSTCARSTPSEFGPPTVPPVPGTVYLACFTSAPIHTTALHHLFRLLVHGTVYRLCLLYRLSLGCQCTHCTWYSAPPEPPLRFRLPVPLTVPGTVCALQCTTCACSKVWAASAWYSVPSQVWAARCER